MILLEVYSLLFAGPCTRKSGAVTSCTVIVPTELKVSAALELFTWNLNSNCPGLSNPTTALHTPSVTVPIVSDISSCSLILDSEGTELNSRSTTSTLFASVRLTVKLTSAVDPDMFTLWLDRILLNVDASRTSRTVKEIGT